MPLRLWDKYKRDFKSIAKLDNSLKIQNGCGSHHISNLQTKSQRLMLIL